MTITRRKGAAAVLMAALLIVGACSSDDSGDDARAGERDDGPRRHHDHHRGRSGRSRRRAVPGRGRGVGRRRDGGPGQPDRRLGPGPGLPRRPAEPVHRARSTATPSTATATRSPRAPTSSGRSPVATGPTSTSCSAPTTTTSAATARPTPPATTSATAPADNAVRRGDRPRGRPRCWPPTPSRRPASVILALWDAEEDGLLGSRGLHRRSAGPAGGHRRLPELGHPGGEPEPVAGRHDRRGRRRDRRARTSSPPPRPPRRPRPSTPSTSASCSARAAATTPPSPSAGVPIVFFTDANNACYHTAQDDVSNLDFDKLGQQILTGDGPGPGPGGHRGRARVRPGTAPPATFDDAVSMLGVVSAAEPDFGLFSRRGQATVDAVPGRPRRHGRRRRRGAFDDDAVSTLLGGSVDIVEALSAGRVRRRSSTEPARAVARR